MDEWMTALDEAFAAYRQDLNNYEKKRKPTDGLLGFGRSLKDDACHERFDERVAAAVSGMAAASPSPGEAERMVRRLLLPESEPWPLAAEWMLRAVERHALPLIPCLAPADAAALARAYTARYRPWDRLPAQKEVCRALKERAAG